MLYAIVNLLVYYWKSGEGEIINMRENCWVPGRGPSCKKVYTFRSYRVLLEKKKWNGESWKPR